MHFYNEIEFLVQVGEYKAGSDPRSDAALAGIEGVREFLRQGSTEQTSWKDMRAWLSRFTN
jgi:type III secretion protein N (ATPase)